MADGFQAVRTAELEIADAYDEAVHEKFFEAYIADPHAGTFQQLVLAAERCAATIIHPGTPLDPDEEDLEKWVKRAERFN